MANDIANIPSETVVRYGDAIGTHGANVISVNSATGWVSLWDNKFRSSAQNVPSSPTLPVYRPADSEQFEKILTSYYGADKTGGRVGNGGLADAVRYEKTAGEMLSPPGHEQKAIEVSNRLSDLICNADNQPPGKYPYSQRDIDFAKQLVKDIDNALGR